MHVPVVFASDRGGSTGNVMGVIAPHSSGLWRSYYRLLVALCLLSVGASASTRNNPTTVRNVGQQQSLHRPLLGLVATATALFPSLVHAASLAPPQLGVDRTGMLSPCPDGALSRCVSSQDDRPSCFVAPWEFDGDWINTRAKLVAYVLSLPGARLISGGEVATGAEPSRYLRFDLSGTEPDLTTAQSPFTDDLEFYFTPNDDIIQYRSVRRIGSDFLGRQNRARIEQIRRTLRLENIAVLRNRQPLFLFMESPLDQFGPPSSMFDGRFDGREGEGRATKGAEGPVAQALHGVHSDFAYWATSPRMPACT